MQWLDWRIRVGSRRGWEAGGGVTYLHTMQEGRDVDLESTRGGTLSSHRTGGRGKE